MSLDTSKAVKKVTYNGVMLKMSSPSFSATQLEDGSYSISFTMGD